MKLMTSLFALTFLCALIGVNAGVRSASKRFFNFLIDPSKLYPPTHDEWNSPPSYDPWNNPPSPDQWNNPPSYDLWNNPPINNPSKLYPPSSDPWNNPPSFDPSKLDLLNSDPWNNPSSYDPWNNPPSHDPWDNPPSYDPWNNPPSYDPWNNPPSHDPWNNPPSHDPWNNPPSYDPWNNPPTYDPWNWHGTGSGEEGSDFDVKNPEYRPYEEEWGSGSDVTHEYTSGGEEIETGSGDSSDSDTFFEDISELLQSFEGMDMPMDTLTNRLCDSGLPLPAEARIAHGLVKLFCELSKWKK